MDDRSDEILTLERRALDRWCRGDPWGFLEASASDVVYFDPFLDKRLDGLAALTRYYEGIRGKISADRWELLDPLVQRAGDMAVLTFNFASWSGTRPPTAGTVPRSTASTARGGASYRRTGRSRSRRRGETGVMAAGLRTSSILPAPGCLPHGSSWQRGGESKAAAGSRPASASPAAVSWGSSAPTSGTRLPMPRRSTMRAEG